MTAIDVDLVRSLTPGTKHGTHLLACGAALMPQPVIDAVTDHLNLEAEIGGYEAAARQQAVLEGVYASVAQLINAHPTEIALLEHATAAWCHAFYAVPMRPGDRVLTCEADYAANHVAMLHRQDRDGIIVEIVPSDSSGAIDLDALASMLTTPARLVALTWVPTNGGLVNPAAEVGRLARQNGALYLLDACQAIGQMPVDVHELGCDFLSATGRKFLRGPRGTGFLYVRQELLEDLHPAMIDHFGAEWTALDSYTLRGDARRFETWENSYALRAGLGASVDFALELGLEAIREHTWGLASRLRDGIRGIDGAAVYDLGANPCAIVSFAIDGVDGSDAVTSLRESGISIGMTGPSSTLIDTQRRQLPHMMRAAPHTYNSIDEIDRLVNELDRLRRAKA